MFMWKGFHLVSCPSTLNFLRNVPSFNYISKDFFSFGFFLSVATPVAMEVPRVGVELELQLLAYTTATAALDPLPQLTTILGP